MSMSCLKNDTVLTWQKLHRRKIKSLQSGCGHLPAELIFSPASPQAKLKRQYSSRLKLSLWHLKNLFPSPPEFAVCDYTRASWRRVGAALPPSPPTYFPSCSRYFQTIGANPSKVMEEWKKEGGNSRCWWARRWWETDWCRHSWVHLYKNSSVFRHIPVWRWVLSRILHSPERRKEEMSEEWNETLSP